MTDLGSVAGRPLEERILYDRDHECDEFLYLVADKRCHRLAGDVATRELCAYEPRCHDENAEGRRYHLAGRTEILAELSCLRKQVAMLPLYEELYEADMEIALPPTDGSDGQGSTQEALRRIANKRAALDAITEAKGRMA